MIQEYLKAGISWTICPMMSTPFVVCLFIAVDEAAPYGVSEQTGLPRLLKTKPQEGSLKATDGGGQGPRRFPITASGGTIGGASP